MTQRRPHWDDELIDDVFRLMDRYAAGVLRGEKNHGTPTFDIIAAVEDHLRDYWDDLRDVGEVSMDGAS